MPKFSGCGCEYLQSIDSEAHIIANALGGWLAPRGILCRNDNNVLDTLADYALFSAFAQWPTLLNIPRQRGRHPAVVIESESGERYRVEANGKRTPADSSYEVTPLADDTHQAQIIAPTWKQADQRIAQMVKQFPHVDPKEARSHARVEKKKPEERWRLGFNFAPNGIFPGVYTSLWLYHVYAVGKPFCTWSELLRRISSFYIADRSSNLIDRLSFWPEGCPGLEGPNAPLSHQLVIKTIPKTGLLIGYAQILGTIRVGGILMNRQKAEIEKIYVRDVFGRKDISADYKIKSNKFRKPNFKEHGLWYPRDARKIANSGQALAVPLANRFEERDAELAALDAAEELPSGAIPLSS